jgi:exoribonuclease II
MSYALFEEAGKFNAGRILSETDSALQVELASGKRVKVKAAQTLMRFAKPSPTELMQGAEAMAHDIDLDLAWEFAPDSDFSFTDLARDYYNANADVLMQAAALWGLQNAPHYFRRLGKGQFRKANAETVKAALAGIEKKRLMGLQVQAWADDLIAGRCPAPVQEQIYKILFKPDKNAPEYKAVVDAAKRSQRPPLDLLRSAGAISNAYQFHWRRFVFECFPQGIKHPPLTPPPISDDLPLASGVEAFSIDDSATTEIDDALSVQGLGSGRVTLGIHIAAPSLAIAVGSAIDMVALQRLSTVYVPGWKLTMLPWSVVEQYTLTAGQAVPAVSLYVSFDETTLELLSSETKIERVPIVSNLRHDQLDALVTEATLADPAQATFPHAPQLAFTYRLAQHLKAQREVVRGKPENFTRPDPVYKLDGRDANADDDGPQGSETITIGMRQRGAPLDLIVAEAMILANSTWGAWLASLKVPAIYRSQASMAPGVKVRMGTKPGPHAGMGVSHYTWATSPLRRYVDLVNQWQIIAAVRHGATAALAAPFKARDASLLAIVATFETAYADYADVQRRLERFWMLRWLQQHSIETMDAVMVQDGLARAEPVPLIFKLAGAQHVPRGAKVRVRVTGIDELGLDVHASLLSVVEPSANAPATADGDDGDDDEDLQADAAPLTLAIDMDDDADSVSTGAENGAETSPADASANAVSGRQSDNAHAATQPASPPATD